MSTVDGCYSCRVPLEGYLKAPGYEQRCPKCERLFEMFDDRAVQLPVAWQGIHYVTLSAEENATIVAARLQGYAEFFPHTEIADSDGPQKTLEGARKFLKQFAP